MALVISSSNYPTAPTIDQMVVVGSGRLARTMYIGNNWKKIRIGIRYCFDQDIGTNITSPDFFVGVCAGTSSVYGDQVVTHSVGVNFNTLLSRSIDSNGVAWYSTQGSVGNAFALNYSGSAQILGTNVSVTNMTTYGTSSIRNALYLDIGKNDGVSATQASCSLVVYRGASGASVGDVSSATFYAQIQNSTPSIVSHSVSTPSSVITITEACGSLDTVNVAWSRTFPSLLIYDFAVHRFL